MIITVVQFPKVFSMNLIITCPRKLQMQQRFCLRCLNSLWNVKMKATSLTAAGTVSFMAFRAQIFNLFSKKKNKTLYCMAVKTFDITLSSIEYGLTVNHVVS